MNLPKVVLEDTLKVRILCLRLQRSCEGLSLSRGLLRRPLSRETFTLTPFTIQTPLRFSLRSNLHLGSSFLKEGAPLVEQPSLLMMVSKDRYAHLRAASIQTGVPLDPLLTSSLRSSFGTSLRSAQGVKYNPCGRRNWGESNREGAWRSV